MTERMRVRAFSGDHGPGRWWSRAGRLALVLGPSFVAVACLSDVELPPCVQKRVPCGGTSNAASGNAGKSAGEGATGGADSAMGGAGASMGGEFPVEGGQAGASGEGGGGAAGAANECADCVIAPKNLPPPCAWRPYEVTLKVSGGQAPYAWQLTPAVEGWSIAEEPAPSTSALVKRAAGAADVHELHITVTDARGRQQRQTFGARARTSCLFAYTALEAGGPKLHLLDPLVASPAPEVLQNNVGAYDFQFSPDGRYIAYRFGAGATNPRGQQLALVELSTLEERVLSFDEDFVHAFAWSPDSSHLAVAFVVNDETHLGGIRLPVSGSQDEPVVLAATPAYAESDLYWIGNHFVAYHAALRPDLQNPGQFLDNPFGLRAAFYAPLGASGFGSQRVAATEFNSQVLLQPAELGFFMITDQIPYTTFTSLAGVEPQLGYHEVQLLVAPSGKYSAFVDPSQLLQIYSAEDGYLAEPVASAASADFCPLPLAWARGTERIACVADVQNEEGAGTHGEVRIFDLESDSDVLNMSTLGGFCKDDVDQPSQASCGAQLKGYSYSVALAGGNARAFSRSGRWFAFVSSPQDENYLYWADLDASTPRVRHVHAFLGDGKPNRPTRLAFSPDERFLLVQYGSKLVLQELMLGKFNDLSQKLATDGGDCTENFSNAPGDYCGHTDAVAPVRWSPESSTLAYRTPDTLTVVDISSFPDPLSFPLLAPECEDACSGQFAFQPSLAP